MSEKQDPLDEPTIRMNPLGPEMDRTDAFESLEDILHKWAESGEVSGSGPSSTHMLRGGSVQPLPDPMVEMLEAWSAKSSSTLCESALLGEGGMAVVYLADQTVPPRQVAVKRLRENTLEKAKQLFAEALLTGSLEHPNIIPVHEIRIDRERGPEVVLKRVEGVSLLQAYEDGGGPEGGSRRLLSKLIPVCNALAYAHARGIIHRDVKAENIMIGQYGEVYLLDWGIAVKTEEAGENRGTVGTPHYIAPEMISGDPAAVDARTDVFLLGATLHYLLVGKPRHDSPSSLGAAVLAMSSKPYEYPATVFRELGLLANRSCALDPDERPQSVIEFRESIEECLKHWDAMRTVRLAQPDFEFVIGVEGHESSLKEKVERFDAAVLRFQVALSSWAGCSEAAWRLSKIRKAMAKHYLDADDPKGALVLIDQIEPEDDAERVEVEVLMQAVVAATDRESLVYRHAAENDMTRSSKGRKQASFAMLAVVALGAAITAYQQITQTVARTAGEGMVIWLLGSCVAVGVIFANRHIMLSNEAGRRALILIMLAPILVAAIRIVVYVHGLDPRIGHPIETFAIAHVCATSVEVFPKGPYFAVFAALLAFVGLAFPHFAYVAFISALLISCTGLIWQWRRGLKD